MSGEPEGGETGAGEPRREPPLGVGEGVRNGIGVLSALREAVEETIRGAVERGDLTPERARQVARSAAQRAGDAVDELLTRLEPPPEAEPEGLRAELDDLRRRVAALEARVGSPPRELLPPPPG